MRFLGEIDLFLLILEDCRQIVGSIVGEGTCNWDRL